MKKLKINLLFASALMLGGGLAVANEVAFVDPNVFNNNASTTGAPDWQPIASPADATCGAASSRACKGYRATPTGAVTNIVTGAKP